MAGSKTLAKQGGIFYDTGSEVWYLIKKSGVDPWLVNERFLQSQLDAKIPRVDFVGKDNVDFLLKRYYGLPDSEVPYRVREIRWLTTNAGKLGYIREGNSWVLTTTP